MPSQKHPRTIDPTLSNIASSGINSHNELKTIQGHAHKSPLLSKLNSLQKCSLIPSHVKSLQQCALHEINKLLTSSVSETHFLTPEEENSLDDGFVLCDLAVIERKLTVWKSLFPRIKPFFALKCNPDPMVAAVLGYHSKEVGFDCASPSEIRLALSSSSMFDIAKKKIQKFHALRCIYANPQRAVDDLIQALHLNVEALTFDGEEELWKVKAAHDLRMQQWKERNEQKQEPLPQPPEMILRLLVPDEHSSIPLGEKFGANPSHIKPLVELACQLHLPVIGISFHCGSGCHDPQAYSVAIELAHNAMDIVNEILMKHDRDPCVLLDIGGGYPGVDGAGADFGRFSGVDCTLKNDRKSLDCMMTQIDHNHNDKEPNSEETAADIAAVVTPLIDQLFPHHSSSDHVHIISEPGRYFVEEAFAVCSRIYSTQTIGEVRHYYIAQGVHGVFKDVVLCGEQFVPLGLSMKNKDVNAKDVEDDGANDDDVQLFPSVVHGPSGDDFDIVNSSCNLPDLEEGDWLIFDHMGAYTISIASRTGKLPIRYVVGGGGFLET